MLEKFNITAWKREQNIHDNLSLRKLWDKYKVKVYSFFAQDFIIIIKAPSQSKRINNDYEKILYKKWN